MLINIYAGALVVYNWAVSVVRAAGIVLEKNKNAIEAIEKQNGKNSSSSGNSSSSSIIKEMSLNTAIESACRYPVVLRLLQLLCGATQILKDQNYDYENHVMDHSANNDDISLAMSISDKRHQV